MKATCAGCGASSDLLLAHIGPHAWALVLCFGCASAARRELERLVLERVARDALGRKP